MRLCPDRISEVRADPVAAAGREVAALSAAVTRVDRGARLSLSRRATATS